VQHSRLFGMNLQEKRLLELLQDHLSDNSMLPLFVADEITKQRRAAQENFLVLAISHIQELSRLYKSGKYPKRLEKLGRFAFDYERVVLESSRFDRQIDPKAVERLMRVLDGTEKKPGTTRVVTSLEFQISNEELLFEMEEENTSEEVDSKEFLRQMAKQYFQELLEDSMQSVRVVGL
jgi:hypothetical protein